METFQNDRYQDCSQETRNQWQNCTYFANLQIIVCSVVITADEFPS